MKVLPVAFLLGFCSSFAAAQRTVAAPTADGGTGYTTTAPSASVSDADILYFAYNLEVLEAQFYTCATTGKPIPSNLLNGGGQPSGCMKANLSGTTQSIGSELARHETSHVALLQSALKRLGINPVAPRVDITTSFEKAAQAAFNNPNLLPAFRPTANDLSFLLGAALFEDVGATAYLGALNLIQSGAYLQTASQIGAAEAYHASMIRSLLFQNISTIAAYGFDIGQITSAIVRTINSLAGPPQLQFPIADVYGSSIANVDSNGLVPVISSPSQVTRIVTLGASAGQGGGFFPDNLNGNIKN